MSYDQVLRDHIFMKTKSRKIQEKLWSSGSDLSLNRAIDVARTMEVSEKCIQTVRKNMNDAEHDVVDVSAITKDSKGVEKRIEWKKSTTRNCYRCGAADHLAKKCPAINKCCNLCKKIGHFSKVCRSMKGVSYISRQEDLNCVRVHEVVLSVLPNDDRMSQDLSAGLPTCDLHIDGVVVTTMVDSCAWFTIMCLSKFKSLWPGRKLIPSDVNPGSYTGHKLPILGYVNVHMEFGKKQCAVLKHDFLGELRYDKLDEWYPTVFLKSLGLREFKNLPPVENTGNINVYELAKKQLQERYGRKINVVLERYKFYSRSQQDEESIDQFVAALRGLAVTCKFEQMSYDQVLRDHIFMKTKSRKIQEKLWSSGSDLSLNRAIDVARTMEVSEKCIQTVRKNMNDAEHDVVDVSAITKDSKGVEKRIEWKKSTTRNCYRCGAADHLAKKCPAINKCCNLCKKIGHFSKVCRSMKGVSYISRQEDLNCVRVHEVVLSVLPNDDRMSQDLSAGLPTCDLRIDGVVVTTMVDSCAWFTIMCLSKFKSLWPGRKLIPSDVNPGSYTGHKIPIVGYVNVHMEFGKKQCAVLKHDFLGELRYDKLDEWYPTVFLKSLGRYCRNWNVRHVQQERVGRLEAVITICLSVPLARLYLNKQFC
ncbi:hypothetical protein NDU88_001674 [Pleurodeles waltl]|uniref:CCHC-type domain-containing protein n=1 Tax=Pleurodeles waltl TaxID=8319 RepID=A0AAV7VCE6_PLEWA|nr:hypothetical protein NDU88_001674 [Pleurodeles waltl]